MSWANSFSWPLLASRYVYPIESFLLSNIKFSSKVDSNHLNQGNPLGSDVLQLFSEVNGTRKLLDFMLDNLAVSTSHPQSRQLLKKKNRNSVDIQFSFFQALDPATASGQGKPYRPFHSHVLQRSL